MRTTGLIMLVVLVTACGDNSNRGSSASSSSGNGAPQARCTPPYVEQRGVCVLQTDTRPPPDAGRGGNPDSGSTRPPDAGTVPSGCAVRTPPVADAQAVLTAWTLTQLRGVSAGALGVLSTVVEGTQPVLLHVVFKGFFNEPGLAGTYLWFDTDLCDPRWDQYGGAVAGMSGSPVYIDGRLAGALSLSYGTRLQGPYPFAATPWETMNSVSADPSATVNPPSGNGGGSGESFDPGRTFAVLDVGNGVALSGAPDHVGALRTMGTDGIVGSCGTTAGQQMSAACAIPGGLRAGSAIAVPVLFGDVVNLSAIGTVTAVSGNRVWAFGHPFFANGPASLPFSGAEIQAIFSDPVFGAFKLGSPRGPILGRINQDRNAAIAGRLGDLSTVLTVRVSVFGGSLPLNTVHLVPSALGAFDRDYFAATGAFYTFMQVDDFIWHDDAEGEVVIRYFGNATPVRSEFFILGAYDTASQAANEVFFILLDAEFAAPEGSQVIDVSVTLTRLTDD